MSGSEKRREEGGMEEKEEGVRDKGRRWEWMRERVGEKDDDGELEAMDESEFDPSFVHYWIKKPNLNTHMGRVSLIVACCGLWELWKFRNKVVYEEGTSDIIQATLRWLWDIRDIGGYRASSLTDIASLGALRIRTPNHQSQIWKPWPVSSVGYTTTIAFRAASRGFVGACVIRDSNKQFITAWTLYRPTDSLRDILLVTQELLHRSLLYEDRGTIQINSKQVLNLLKGHKPPWRAAYLIRACVKECGYRDLCFLCNNHSKMVLLLGGLRDRCFQTVEELPAAARCGYNTDIECLC